MLPVVFSCRRSPAADHRRELLSRWAIHSQCLVRQVRETLGGQDGEVSGIHCSVIGSYFFFFLPPPSLSLSLSLSRFVTSLRGHVSAVYQVRLSW